MDYVSNLHGCAPFLKWTGGKRWLASELHALAPKEYGRYIEPFLGGGAVFFHLRPWPAFLSDVNAELINTYRQVRDNVDDVIGRLARLRIDPDVYTDIRNSVPRKPVTQAVRFLYLNRTAFNGIYRVNRRGRFNVPFGCKPGTVLCDEPVLRSASKALQNRKLAVCDFEDAIDAAKRGDLVYADPPYTTKHDNNGFQRYNEVIFSWDDQVRLAECCQRARSRGVHVIVSNANHPPVRRMYHGFKDKTVKRPSLISGPLHGRGTIAESLIYCFATR
jgi:DNA adenine methylase